MFGALLLFEDEFIHVVSISFTALILTELIMVALTIRTWHWLMVLAEFLSLAIYIMSLIILKDFFGKYIHFKHEYLVDLVLLYVYHFCHHHLIVHEILLYIDDFGSFSYNF